MRGKGEGWRNPPCHLEPYTVVVEHYDFLESLDLGHGSVRLVAVTTLLNLWKLDPW